MAMLPGTQSRRRSFLALLTASCFLALPFIMASSGPSYGLNGALSVDTVEPPVPLARAWAASYPSSSSPLHLSSLPLLNLAQGVPGHPPHPRLIEAIASETGRNSMEAHGYGPVFGDASLRESLARDISERYLGSVCAAEVAITSGCNLAAGVTFHALARPGEAVVLPTPWYFNHEMTLTSLSINVLPLETSAPSFLPSTSAFTALLEKHNAASASPTLPKIKAIVLVTPNNPTGSIYPIDLVWQFARICAAWKVACIVDETYRDFLLDENVQTSSPLALARPHDLFDRDAHPDFQWQNTVVSLHSFSKSYAIPGHRLGAIIAHRSLLIAEEEDAEGKSRARFGSLAKSLDNLQICPPRTDTQRAVAASIADEEQQQWRAGVANDLLKRRTTFFTSLQEETTWARVAKQLQLPEDTLRLFETDMADGSLSPQSVGWKGLCSGGYYAYVRHPFANTSSETVARGLAALTGVVVLPGSFFRPKKEASLDRDLRISVANVESSKLDTLAARLLLLYALWTSRGVGWGI